MIEDDTTLGEIVEEVMTEEGYEVRRTNDGRSGLGLIESWEPDVVLLDVMMPSMNAFQLRDHQRRMNIGPSSWLGCCRPPEIWPPLPCVSRRMPGWPSRSPSAT